MKQTISMKDEFERYSVILDDIKSLLERAKLHAYKAVDNIRVQTYWQVGERIAREEFKFKERAGYGKNLISKLSGDLKFEERLIYRMLQFYKTYPILSQVATELSWSHYTELLSIKENGERKIYEILSIKNAWGRNELRKAISNHAAKKYKKSQIIKLSPAATELQPQEIFKSAYNFEFLDLKKGFNEGDLKSALLQNFEKEERKEADNPTIGIILCTDKNESMAKYTLLEGNKSVFASKYKLYLPTEKELTDEITKERRLIEMEKRLKA